MASAYDVLINFTAKDNATTTANKTADAVDNVAKSGTKATASVKGLSGGLGALVGAMSLGAVVSFAKSISDAGIAAMATANKFDNVRKSLQLMMKDKAAGDALYVTMEQLAARTPFSFDDVAQGTQKLLAMGFAAKDIPSLMTTIGDTASALGTGAEGIDRISRALGQMQAKGKITTEEMMQLQEMGVPAFKLLADASGISQQALMEMVTKGIIPADQNLQTLINAMDGEYGGMMATQMNTATAAQSNFQDATDKAKASIGRLIEPTAIRWFNNLATAADYATGVIKGSVQWFQWLDKAMISAQLSAQGYTQAQIDATNFIRGNTYKAIQDATFAQTAYVNSVNRGTTATRSATVPLKINTDETKKATSAGKSLSDIQGRLTQANRSLRDSFFAIADAQRNVKATREALEDATNPRTLEEYEIAADRAYYSNELLNNEIKRMQTRQKDIRSQLSKGNLTQEDRNALIEEDAQLTEDLIGKQIDARQSVIDLEKAQKALDRARDPARIQEYTDAHQQAINKVNDLTVDQGVLTTSTSNLQTQIQQTRNAQIEHYKSVMEASVQQNNLNLKLNDGAVANARNKDEVLKAIQPIKDATIATTAYKDENNKLATSYVDIYKGKDQAVSTINGVSEAMAQSKDNQEKYLKRVSDIGGALKFSYNAASDLTKQLTELSKRLAGLSGSTGGGTQDGNQGGNQGGGQPTTPTSWQTSVANDFAKYTTDGVLSSSEMNYLMALGAGMGANSQDVGNYVNGLIQQSGGKVRFEQGQASTQQQGRSLNGTSSFGRGGIASMPRERVGLWGGANVSITLNYASPPESKNPLADVEEYINAQGGLIRV